MPNNLIVMFVRFFSFGIKDYAIQIISILAAFNRYHIRTYYEDQKLLIRTHTHIGSVGICRTYVVRFGIKFPRSISVSRARHSCVLECECAFICAHA